MMLTGRKMILTGVGVAALLLTLVSAVIAAPWRVAPPEPWPSFVMTYTDTNWPGDSERSSEQSFRLTYIDQWHFTSKLLSHSRVPSAVGYTQTFDGGKTTTVDPRLGTVQSATLPNGEPTVPADWLVPGRRPALTYRMGTTVETQSGGLMLATWASVANGKQVTEQITYRELDGIPVRFVQTVDGVESRRVEVTELTITK